MVGENNSYVWNDKETKVFINTYHKWNIQFSVKNSRGRYSL